LTNVASIIAVPFGAAAAEYAVRIEEEAGKKRVVLLEGIEF